MGHVLPFVPLHVSTDTLCRLFGADADRAGVLAEPGAGALLFDWLHLASPAGIQALRDAALDQGVSLPADVDERSRGAWACDVLALAARDPAWRAVLARVRATASRDRPAHASYDARLAGRVAIGDTRDVEERLARELAARLAPSGQGRELRVRVTCGAHVEIAIAHDETSATALLAVDRIAGDTAVRLHVLARTLVGVYLAALGSALAASPIARRRSVSLLPIAQRRAAVLVPSRATSAELAHVRAIALEWDGDDDRGVLRGHDVLASAERRGMRLENGALVEVVLRLVLRAAGAGVVDVWVREPDEVTLSDERHLPLVRRLLADAGVVPAADGAPDLWSLEPWAHPEDVWASALGADAVARLSSAQILTPLRARAVASRAAPAASRSLVALPLADEPGAWWGTTEDPSVRAVTLRDLLGYVRLDPTP